MKACELIESLIEKYGPVPDDSIDTCKTGNPDKEVKKIAVCCIATVDIIKAATEWGADLLITHEPTYFNHFDNLDLSDSVTYLKHKLIEESGICIWRYHDSPHLAEPDIINTGLIKKLGWQGDFQGKTGFILHNPQTAAYLASDIEQKLGIPHVDLVGVSDVPISRISLSTGQRDINEVLRDDWYELIVAGEITEWSFGEYVRDAALLGKKKSMLVLGHIASEREGMKYTAQLLADDFPFAEVKYYESKILYENN